MIKKIAFVFALSVALAACKKNSPENTPETPKNTDDGKEYKYLNVLVSDEATPVISQINPFNQKVSTYNAKFPMANLYTTASGRYAAVIHTNQNLVEIFDSGLQSHVDHVDVDGEPKWAAITADGAKPVHFKSKGNESLIFNDNDGTLSVANEADFNTAGSKFKIINAGLVPHHGAMAQFDNGNYAVTSANQAKESPNRVIVIDKGGKTLFPSTIEVSSIHGNAADGQNAVFGAFKADKQSGGVLIVNQNGTQKFLDNPAGLGAFRFGNIQYASGAKKFIAYGLDKGAYLVDIDANKMTPIYEGADAYQCKVDYAGKNLLVLTYDGKLRIYDLVNNKLKKEGNALAAIKSTDTPKPVLEASTKFAYIANPSGGEVLQVDLNDFTKVTKHKVSARPVKLILLGFESNASH